jgi:hypothetical protein
MAVALVLATGGDACADDVRVERAGEAAVPGDEQQADGVDALVLAEDRHARHRPRRFSRDARHPPDRADVGSQRLDALFGSPQARGGDHLHRARDLLDVLDRGDPRSDVSL